MTRWRRRAGRARSRSFAAAAACRSRSPIRSAARGRSVLLFPLHGAADPADYRSAARITGFTSARSANSNALARAAGCRDVVFIGSLVRPALWQMRLGLAHRWHAAAHRRGLSRRRRSSALEHRRACSRSMAFACSARTRSAPEILMPEGALGRVQPSRARPRRHRLRARLSARQPGRSTSGRRWWWPDKHVLAVEAAEGTDAMLARVAEMRAQRPHARSRRDRRAGEGAEARAGPRASTCLRSARARSRARRAPDLPASRSSPAAAIIAEPAAIVAAADRAKIFVVGVPAGTAR